MNEFILTTISNKVSPLESCILACFHAFFFSLPICPPNILCLVNLNCKGGIKGGFSYLSASISQTVFITLIIFGSYNIIQLWYDFEPFIFLFGCIITFQIICASFTGSPASLTPSSDLSAFSGGYAFSYASGSRINALTDAHVKTLKSFSPYERVDTKTFTKQLMLIFVLQLCNPVCLFQPTRYVTSFEIHFPGSSAIMYLLCFCIAMFFFSTIIGSIISITLNKFYVGLPVATGENKSTRSVKPDENLIAFFMSTLLFTGLSKYSWRIFVQYPPDAIGNYFNLQELTRELPSRDSGIRRRFIDNPSIGRPRRIPIEEFSEALQVMREEKSSKSEKVNMYFDEESKRSREQVIVRFKSHFINRFINKVNETRVFLRTPFTHTKTAEQIEYLKPSVNQHQDNTIDADFIENTLNNNKKKGKPKHGYITFQPVNE